MNNASDIYAAPPQDTQSPAERQAADSALKLLQNKFPHLKAGKKNFD